jgi:hypothetical protein
MARQTFLRSGSRIEKQAGVFAQARPVMIKHKSVMAIFTMCLRTYLNYCILFWLTMSIGNLAHCPLKFQGGSIMSEIRPANNRPDIPRVQQERSVKTEQKQKEEPPQKTEAQREVTRHEVKTNDKPKGGNVDITV